MNALKVNAKNQKTMIWIAFIMANIYSLAYFYLVEFWPPPPPTLSAEQVVALYAHANLQFRIGVVVMIVTGAFYTPWSIVVAIQMARDEPGIPIWAITQVLTSTIGSALFAFPPVIWGMAAFSVERAPELTLLLHEVAWLTFITPASFFSFQTFTIAVVALSAYKKENSAFPRWLGWLTLWTGITGTAGVMAQLFKTGPFAWNGIFPFYLPLAVFAIWLFALGITMYRAIGRQEQAGA